MNGHDVQMLRDGQVQGLSRTQENGKAQGSQNSSQHCQKPLPQKSRQIRLVKQAVGNNEENEESKYVYLTKSSEKPFVKTKHNSKAIATIMVNYKIRR